MLNNNIITQNNIDHNYSYRECAAASQKQFPSHHHSPSWPVHGIASIDTCCSGRCTTQYVGTSYNMLNYMLTEFLLL